MPALLLNVSLLAILSQQGKLPEGLKGLYFILGGFVLLVAILAIIVATLRKKWLNEQPDTSDDAPFSISDLKRLYREGQLTEEEFEKAKAQIIAMHTAADLEPETEKSVEKPPQNPDNPQ